VGIYKTLTFASHLKKETIKIIKKGDSENPEKSRKVKK